MRRKYAEGEVAMMVAILQSCPVSLDAAVYTPHFECMHDAMSAALGKRIDRAETRDRLYYVRKTGLDKRPGESRQHEPRVRHTAKEIRAAQAALSILKVPLDRTPYSPHMESLRDRIAAGLGRPVPMVEAWRLALYYRKSHRCMAHKRSKLNQGRAEA